MKTLKENTLREEFITLLADYQITVSSEFPNQDDIDIILRFINSKFDELERRMKGNTISHNGFYNKGVQDSISILNEMRGEK